MTTMCHLASVVFIYVKTASIFRDKDENFIFLYFVK